MKKIFLGCLALLLMNACGWHFRGSQANELPVRHINLSATDIYTPLYRTFKQEYERQGIEVENRGDAPRLKLLNESRDTRTVSFNTELDPAEVELTLVIHYLVNDTAFEMQEKQTYDQDKNRAAARENAKNILIEQMRRRLADRILQQLVQISQRSGTQPDTHENISR